MCKQFRKWQIFRIHETRTNAIGKPRSANMRTLLLWVVPASMLHAMFTLQINSFAPPSPRCLFTRASIDFSGAFGSCVRIDVYFRFYVLQKVRPLLRSVGGRRARASDDRVKREFRLKMWFVRASGCAIWAAKMQQMNGHGRWRWLHGREFVSEHFLFRSGARWIYLFAQTKNFVWFMFGRWLSGRIHRNSARTESLQTMSR